MLPRILLTIKLAIKSKSIKKHFFPHKFELAEALVTHKIFLSVKEFPSGNWA